LLFKLSYSQDFNNRVIVIDTAQIECIYRYQVIAPKQYSLENPTEEGTVTDVFQTILQANAKVSKFWSWNFYKIDSIQYNSQTQITSDSIKRLNLKYNYNVRCVYLSTVVKNFPKNEISVIDKIVMDDYYYREKKATRQWVLKEDSLNICGYSCNKAECAFDGRKWTVWYAPEIPISDGPWKLYGLPGLILKAVDATGVHTFEATNIRNSKLKIYLLKDYDQLKIKKKTFISKRDLYETNFQPYVGPEWNKLISIINGVVFVGKSRTTLNTVSNYCPLDIE
jgi:GLPGLI family protein